MIVIQIAFEILFAAVLLGVAYIGATSENVATIEEKVASSDSKIRADDELKLYWSDQIQQFDRSTRVDDHATVVVSNEAPQHESHNDPENSVEIPLIEPEICYIADFQEEDAQKEQPVEQIKRKRKRKRTRKRKNKGQKVTTTEPENPLIEPEGPKLPANLQRFFESKGIQVDLDYLAQRAEAVWKRMYPPRQD